MHDCGYVFDLYLNARWCILTSEVSTTPTSAFQALELLGTLATRILIPFSEASLNFILIMFCGKLRCLRDFKDPFI